MQTLWHNLETVIADAARSLPLQGMQLLIEGAKNLTGATSALLYLLQLDRAKFITSVGNPATILDAPEAIDVDILESNATSTFFESAIQKRQVISRTIEKNGHQFTQMAVPIKRYTSCLGLLVIQSAGGGHFSQDQRVIPSILAHTIVLLIEKQSSLRLLEAVQQPINFHQSLNDYLQDILLLIAVASGMPMIAIREFESDSKALRCIAKYGLEGELSSFDLEPYVSVR